MPRDDDGFMQINPLIAIMGWWKANAPESQFASSPETALVEACRGFLLAHETAEPPGR